jgi:hypothetical protein
MTIIINTAADGIKPRPLVALLCFLSAVLCNKPKSPSMPQLTSNATDHKLTRWQFSISGMLVFTLSVAIGAAVVQVNVRDLLATSAPVYALFKAGLCGLLIIIAFWMICGILYQVRDLRSVRVSHPPLCSEHRWGLRFEIFWRLIMALLMAICILMVFLINQKIIILPVPSDISYLLIGSFIDVVPAILLLALVGSVPYVRRKEYSSLLHRGLWLIVCVLAGALCLELWSNQTLIHHLVHIATAGIDYAQPLQFSSIDSRYYKICANLFFWWSILSSMIVIINWAILGRLARKWSRGFKQRLPWIVLLIAGVTATSTFVIWLYARGLKEISPCLAESCNEAPIHYWLSAALLVIILVTIITYRSAVDRDQIVNMPLIEWRRNPQKYYHEWRAILLLLTIAISFYCLDPLNRMQILFSQILWGVVPPPFRSWSEIIYGLIGMPINCLWLALILLALHRTFARREDPQQSHTGLPRINPARLITVWFATLAVMVSSALVLVWMSFALWFNPWWSGRWP